MRTFLCLALVFVCSVSMGQTADIPVNNSGFELNSGWSINYGTINEPDGAFMSQNYPGQQIPSGDKVITLGGPGWPGSAMQILPMTLQSNTTYQFEVKVGSRNQNPFTGGNQYVGMVLRVDDDDLTILAKTWTGNPYQTNDIALSGGVFNTVSLSYTTGDLTGDAAEGKSLLLYLEAGEIALDFDQVIATATSDSITAVPVTVSTNPEGVETVDILGSYDFIVGTEITLNAEWMIDCPDQVFGFKQWNIDGAFLSSNATETFIIDSAMTITAEFEDRGGCQAFGGTEVAVLNADFETPQSGEAGWVSAAADGWFDFGIATEAWDGYALVANVGTVLHFKEDMGWNHHFPGVDRTMYGTQVAHFGGGGGWEQVLGETLKDAKTYTLEFDLGMPKNRPVGWFHAAVFAGNNKLFTAGVNMSTTPEKIEGYDNGADLIDMGQVLADPNDWVHQTLTFVTNSTTVGIGQPLKLRFYGEQMMVDNVVLLSSGMAAPVTLDISVESNGDIVPDTVTPVPDSYVYPYGSAVNLTALNYVNCPEVYAFAGWQGDLASTESQMVVTLNGDVNAVASFEDAAECGDECHPISPFDSDENCMVDFTDLAAFALEWLKCTTVECLNN